MARVSVSAVWDRSTEFLADNLGVVMPIALAWIAAPLAVQSAIAPLGKGADTSINVIMGIAGLALALVVAWGQLQIYALSVAPDRPPAEARRLATARLPLVIGLTAVLIVAALILVVPVYIALVAAGGDIMALIAASWTGTPATVPQIGEATSMFIAIYALVLFCVFLWASARLALVNVVALAERRGLGSFARAYQLSRGSGGALIGLMILFVVVSGVAALAAKTVFGTMFGLILGGEGPITIASVLTAIFTALVSAVFSVLFAAFIGKFYLAARAHDPLSAA